MARLTDNLATGYRGKETQRAVDPGPSIWEGIAKTVSAAAGVVDTFNQTEKRIKGETTAAATAAQKASDLGAKNDLAQGMAEIAVDGPGSGPQTASEVNVQAAQVSSPGFAPNTAAGSSSMSSGGQDDLGLAVVDPAAAAATAVVAKTAAKMGTAVEQGRANETSYQLKMHTLISNLFTKFPNSKAVVWEEFKKFGIDHPLLAPYARANAAMDAESSDAVKNELADARYYDENLTVGQDDPNADFATKVGEGQRMRALENEYGRITKRSAEQRAAAGEDRTSADRARKDSTIAYVTAWQTYMGPKFQETTQQLTKLTLDPSIADGTKFPALSDAVNAYRSGAYQAIEEARLDIIERSKGNVDLEQLTAASTGMRKQVDDVLMLFDPSNPLNVISKNATQLKMITDATGLEITRAAPILMELKKKFPNSDSLNLLLETTMSDPKITKLLSYEMKNFQGLGSPDSKVHLMNMINMISDRNTNLRDLSPDEGANTLKNLQGYLVKALPEAARTGSEGLTENSITGLGKLANVAIDLKPGTPLYTTMNALNLLANNSAATVLINGAKSPTNGAYANLVADGVRAATTQQIINASKANVGDAYYNVVFNSANGTFETKANGKAPPNQGGYDYMATGKRVVPAPSEHTKIKTRVLNDALNFMVKTGQFEDEMPIVKWTNPEQRAFYATGTVPAGRREESPKVEGTMQLISKVANQWKNFKVDWSQVTPVTYQDAAGARGIENNPEGYSKVAPLIKSSAEAHGVPEKLAVALIGKESSFVVGNEGPVIQSGTHKGDRAKGLGQVMAKTAASFGVSDRSKLDAAGEVDLALRVLKANYNSTGNWKDAVSMYFTGVSYDKAVKQGRSDGFNTVLQYVQDIL